MLVYSRKGDMNKLILCHKSGLECLREFRYQKQDSRIVREATKVLLSKKRQGKQTFDVLVNSQNMKHNNWRYHFHVQKPPVPKQSFIKVSDFISIACPELLPILFCKVIQGLISFSVQRNDCHRLFWTFGYHILPYQPNVFVHVLSDLFYPCSVKRQRSG